MRLARWNPAQDLLDFHRETSDLLRRTFPSGWFEPWSGQAGSRMREAWAPAVDVFAREGDLVVRAELPGIDPEQDVDISYQDGMLTLHGERRHESRSEGDTCYRVESTYGSFHRTVALPENVKADDIRASYTDGILEVVIPKAAETAQPKRIPIATGEGRPALTAKGGRTKK